jgi:DNA polymerase III epsilon subunit-like protein
VPSRAACSAISLVAFIAGTPALAAGPAQTQQAPTVAALTRELDQLATRYALRPRRLARLRSGLADPSPASRLQLWRAIQSERAAQELRAQIDTYDAKDYRAGEGAASRSEKDVAPREPKPPLAAGVFSPAYWSALDAHARAGALGLVEEGGQLARPGGGKYKPALAQAKRTVLHRRVPRLIDGLLRYLFPKDRADALAGKLDQVLQPTAEGSYRLFANKVELLYPDTPISPADKPRYSQRFRELVKDAAFVFVQTYELTDPKVIELLDGVSRGGTPVYALLGSAPPKHPALPVWQAKGSRVRFATSYAENQGAGRQFRIDHNKNVFVLKKDGTVTVLKGGMNLNTLSTQNVDLGHALEGGNVGLDVLGPMVRDYLRAGGKMSVADLKLLAPAVEKMIRAVPGRDATTVETAQTSSGFVGHGERLSIQALDARLASPGELFVSGRSVLSALAAGKGRGRSAQQVAQREARFLDAARRGKRIVISLEPELSAADRTQLRTLTAPFEQAGVEVVDAAALYVDNSTEAVMHRLVRDAAARGEGIWQAAFAGTDGNFTRRILEASDQLKAANDNHPSVKVLLSDLQIEDRTLNSASAAQLLFHDQFNGKVIGIRKVPGPSDEKGGRKMHMKALASYRPAERGSPASGFYTLKSNNDSKHGFTTNEESSLTVHSPELALEVIRFFERVERSYGQALTPAIDLSRLPLSKRPSLTKRLITPTTRLEDVVFVVMDFETDGFSLRSDSRLTEQAAAAYELDAQGRLVPVSAGKLPSKFQRYVHMGKDHYGTPKQLSKDVAKLTGISNEMLRHEAGVVEVMNDFNGWIRTLEKKTGKTILFVGHNLATFDRRMYNDFSSIAGVVGNPYMDGEVADTLRSTEKILPQGPKQLVPAATKLGVVLPPGRAHDAIYDVEVNGLLLAKQLEHLAKGQGKRSPRDLEWGHIRSAFLSARALKEAAARATTAEAPPEQAALGTP